MTSKSKTRDNQDRIARAVAEAFGPVLDDILVGQEHGLKSGLLFHQQN